MIKATAYETSDGQLFKTKAEASAHEAGLEFDPWYRNHPLFGHVADDNCVKLEVLKEWLRSNRAEVLNFLGDNDYVQKYDGPSS